jgi:thiamine biosynthesis lipoprotein
MTALPQDCAGLERGFDVMDTHVTLRVIDPTRTAEQALDRATARFHAVERACTRFDRGSPLMQANAERGCWHQVPPECLQAVAEAYAAYRLSGGLFDPRVVEVLERWGYDRTLPFREGSVIVEGRECDGTERPKDPWRPGVDRDAGRVRVGPDAVDLGGIAKGLAIRWVAADLAGSGAGFLVDAGGDMYLSGIGPDYTAWRVGVEDPLGGENPVAVLAVGDAGCATSSVRLRHWRVGGHEVHHLVDPRTGRPGGEGLLSVSVVHADPAWAEVWSKVLFLTGAAHISSYAEERRLAALWVDRRGCIGTSSAMDPLVTWRYDNE